MAQAAPLPAVPGGSSAIGGSAAGAAPLSPRKPQQDAEVTQMMVNYLLDNLQPYLWAKRHEALHRFENFAFSLYPNFSSEMAIEILIGRAGKGRGLLETVGGVSWRTGALRASAVVALKLLLRLIDPNQNPSAKVFSYVLKRVDRKHIESMALGKHFVTSAEQLSSKDSASDAALVASINDTPAGRLVRFFRQLRPDVPISFPVNKNSAAAAAAAATSPDGMGRRSSLYDLLQADADSAVKNRRLSARSFMQQMVQQNVLKDAKIKPPPPPRQERTGTRIGNAIKEFFTKPKGPPSPGASGTRPAGGKQMSSKMPSGPPPGSAVKAGKVFGIPLEQVVLNTCDQSAGSASVQLPPILVCPCEQIEARGMRSVGLFRLPGNVRVVQENKSLINEGKPVDWHTMHVDTLTSLLKLWFREMPEPVFTFDMYQPFVDAQQMNDDTARLQRLQELCERLPALNKETLGYLFRFLARVAEHHEAHKMTAKNLCMVFAPNLIRPKDEKYEQIVNDSSHVLALVHSLLTDHGRFFPAGAAVPALPPVPGVASSAAHPAAAAVPVVPLPGARPSLPPLPPLPGVTDAVKSSGHDDDDEDNHVRTQRLTHAPSVSVSQQQLRANVEQDDDFDLSDEEDMPVLQRGRSTVGRSGSTGSVNGGATDGDDDVEDGKVSASARAAAAATLGAAGGDSVRKNSTDAADGADSTSAAAASGPVHRSSRSMPSAPTGAALTQALPPLPPLSGAALPAGGTASASQSTQSLASTKDGSTSGDSRAQGRMSKRTSVTHEMADMTQFMDPTDPAAVARAMASSAAVSALQSSNQTGSSSSASNTSGAATRAPGGIRRMASTVQEETEAGIAAEENHHSPRDRGVSGSSSLFENLDSSAAATVGPRRSEAHDGRPSISLTSASIQEHVEEDIEREIELLTQHRSRNRTVSAYTDPFANNNASSASGAAASSRMSVSGAGAAMDAAGRARTGSMLNEPRRWGYWVEYHDDDGQPYYFNTVSQETRWEPPHGFAYRSRHSTVDSMITHPGK